MKNFKIFRGKKCRRKSARPKPRQSVLRPDTKSIIHKRKKTETDFIRNKNFYIHIKYIYDLYMNHFTVYLK